VRRALVVIALLALACAREQKPQAMPKRCDGMCGRVIDARTKQPLHEFTIYIYSTRPLQIALPPGYPYPPGRLVEERVIESNDGSFVLRAWPEPVIVMVTARGYKAMTTKPIDASTPIDAALTRAGQIAGHVADEHGHPVAGAHVNETITDANGDFTIDEPPAEWRQIDVSDDRHLPKRMIVHRADTRIDIVLRDAVVLAGTVRDENDAPVSGAGVQVSCIDFDPIVQSTQRDGSFAFHVPPSRCTLVAGAGLYNDEEQHAVMPTEPRTILDLDMTNGFPPVVLRLPPRR